MTDHKREQPLTSDQLGRAFRQLADEYTIQGASSNDATWAKIEAAGFGDEAPGLRVAPAYGARPRRFAYYGLAAAVATSLAVLGWSALLGSPESDASLSYSVDGVASSLSEGAEGELIASEGQPVVVEFADDTRVTLRPYSTLRLDAVGGEKSVTARLSQGKAEFESGEDPQATFILKAGVYTLKPMGAAFSFAYMPHEQRLDVQSRRGALEVEAAGGRSYRVESGVALSLPESRDSHALAARSDTSEVDAVASVDGQTKAITENRPSARGPSAEKSFKELASEGKFTEIVAIAKKRGISQVLATANASDLHELGQAARYAGDLALASQTWTHMTQRFNGAPAQSARFFLGRLAEQQGNSTLALSHYGAYLEGSGGGVYTAEALGRKLSIVHQSHGVQKARPIAEEYLRRFPQGAYAKTARELVGGE